MFSSSIAGRWRVSVCTIPRHCGRGGWSNDSLTPRKGSSFLELLGDPILDVNEPIPEVPACFEAGGTLSAVSPCVEGGYRYVQVYR